MSDIESKLNMLLAQTDAFKPLPPRKMYGQTYENIPPGRKYKGGNEDEYTQPYDPNETDQTQLKRYLHTFEPDSPTATFWKLKEFLGM